jgi:RimJ/RimL family protein N-acetyltransferase
VIDTARLQLCEWRDDHRAPFAALNADPEVMEHLPSVLTRAMSDAFVDRIRSHFDRHGYGLWALHVRATGEFIGYTGLVLQTFPAHFTPAVEVGWRLARAHWGQGYATEGARAALEVGFTRLGLDEIVSMTVPANARSRRVMERIGMTRDSADDFDHPRVPAGNPMRRHLLYRLSRADWAKARG